MVLQKESRGLRVVEKLMAFYKDIYKITSEEKKAIELKKVPELVSLSSLKKRMVERLSRFLKDNKEEINREIGNAEMKRILTQIKKILKIEKVNKDKVEKMLTSVQKKGHLARRAGSAKKAYARQAQSPKNFLDKVR